MYCVFAGSIWPLCGHLVVVLTVKVSVSVNLLVVVCSCLYFSVFVCTVCQDPPDHQCQKRLFDTLEEHKHCLKMASFFLSLNKMNQTC